jgi:hypothetical protein
MAPGGQTRKSMLAEPPKISHCIQMGKMMRIPGTTITKMEVVLSIDQIVMAFAGGMILVSLLLSLIHHPYWLFLTAIVGVNLFQAAFTGFCPLAVILKKSGLKPGAAFE